MSEPSFEPDDIIAAIAPMPLFMIQSTKDKYITEAVYRRFEAAAKRIPRSSSSSTRPTTASRTRSPS